MSVWDAYPADYRAAEVGALAAAVNAGECVSVVGLSGAGKSNLLGFIANRPPLGGVRFALVDCNRLRETAPGALFKLIRAALDDPAPAEEEWPALESAVAHRLAREPLCLLFDRFDPLAESAALAGNLRALRDAHKYDLTFVIATRRPLPARTELAELFAAHTLWLGPLSPADARWNVERYMQRLGQRWGDETVARLIEFSGAYPSLLRAACEAYAANPDPDSLADHPAVRARLEEFWADAPSPDDLRSSGLAGHPLLAALTMAHVDTSQLTAKENLLLIC
nr:ATP-binding protein [Chloroflexota bacterium]